MKRLGYVDVEQKKREEAILSEFLKSLAHFVPVDQISARYI